MFCSLNYLNLIFLDSSNEFYVKKFNITKIRSLFFDLSHPFGKFSDLKVFDLKQLSNKEVCFLDELRITETNFCFFEYSLFFYCFCLNKKLKFNFFNILSERKKVLNRLLRSQQFNLIFNNFCDFFFFSSFFFKLFIKNNFYFFYNSLQCPRAEQNINSNLGFFTFKYFFFLKKSIFGLNSV